MPDLSTKKKRKRGAGRPRKSELAENTVRDRILEAAEHVFSEKGFSAAGLREIAKRSGHSLAIVTYYFGTKEKLAVAVFEHHLASHYKVISEMTARETGRFTLQNLKNIFRQTIDWYGTAIGLRASRIQTLAKVEGNRALKAAAVSYWSQSTAVGAEMLRQLNPKLGKAEALERSIFLMLIMQARTELHWIYAENSGQLNDRDTVVRHYERWLFERFMPMLVEGEAPDSGSAPGHQ